LAPEPWEVDARERYEEVWSEIDGLAETAQAALQQGGVLDLRLGDPRWFAVLEAHLSARRDATHTLMVVDPTGFPGAWGGAGLLHPVEEGAIPRSGRRYRMSFSAVTLFAVYPLEDAKRPRRLIVGRSFDRDTYPWGNSSIQGAHAWAVRRSDPDLELGRESGLAAPISLADTPTLWISEAVRFDASEGFGVWLRCLLALLATGFLFWAARRFGRSEFGLADGATRVLFAGGLGALAVAVGATVWSSAAFTLFLACALAALARPRDLGSVWRAAAGVVMVTLPALWIAERLLGSFDSVSLGGQILDLSAEGWVLRGALAVSVAAAFALFQGARTTGFAQFGVRAGIVLLFIAAAFSSMPLYGLPFFAAALFSCALGLANDSRRLTLRWIGAWCVVSALASAVAWQMVELHQEEDEWVASVLPRLTEAPAEPLETLVESTLDIFDGADVSELFVGDPSGVVRDDLAYALWRRSTLAVEGTLSALVVTADDRLVSSFSFGLPVDEDGNLDRTSERWEAVEDLVFLDALDGSEIELHLYGHPWAQVRFWVAVLPTFRGPELQLGDLAPSLLRGGPAATTDPANLLPGAKFVLYDAEGAVLSSPWAQSPVLPEEESEAGPQLRAHDLSTPDGEARAYSWREPRGVAAMFVPKLRPGMGLERVGVQAVGGLLTLGLVVVFWLALGIRSRALIEGARAVLRSYPQRLLVAYTVLLLVPVLLLNAVLLQTVSRRLESEKRSAGIAAMEAAQSILGEYVVSLEPGFVLETAVDDNLLLWLSQVVGHELNLYWGSRLSASSKPELFAAGFLPERIPGEVYAELSTGQLPLASRPRQAGGADYLEFYAPLRVPGVDRLGANLFLSMPLLAQEEEVAGEIAALRRKALLASTGLFLLLLAVGGQLARNFTAPIMDLVRGTERIAAGEGRLGIEPRDTELLTLSRAIDDMADRIGRARSQLQREKEVVESMVENITAGVVSLDTEGRVVTANRVAKDLLGVEIGGTLESAADGDGRLATLMEFVDGDSGRLRRATLRLRAPDHAIETDEDPAVMDWSTVWVPLAPGGELGALLVVEDVTEVLQGQRLQAWAEMARMIAHEIKNPLTPIRLSTEHLREVYSSNPERIGEIFERCTSNILTQVDELRLISSEFATYSRIPKINPVEGDLVAVCEQIVTGYAASASNGVTVELVTSLDKLKVRFDPKLIRRALRNLVENAVRASSRGQVVSVAVDREQARALVVVRDQGPGVAAEDLDRIFEPYFSTHETGTGLGLPITRRIAEEHGGTITARNQSGGGLAVRISLPLTGGTVSHS